MKTLALIIFTTLSFLANAQTASNDSAKKQIKLEKTEQADLLVSIPMIGNITLKKIVIKQLQEDLQPITLLKVVEIDSIQFYELVNRQIDVAAGNRKERKNKYSSEKPPPPSPTFTKYYIKNQSS